MKFLKLIPILFIFFGNGPYRNEVHAEIKNPEDFRVLSNESKKLSISNVQYFINEGDKYIKNGDFEEAKKSGNFSQEQLDQAYEYILLAEGSDWFWWYGLDQDSTVDYYFDQAFKDLLNMVYLSLGLEQPNF